MKLPVPKDITQIPLEAFQKLNKIEEPTPVDTISCLCELNPRIVRAIKARSIDDITNHLNTLFDRQFGLVQRFKMNGVEYGFIPNLDDATYGEVDDIRNFIGDVKDWHRAMGVLYRPVTDRKGRKYKIEKYDPGKYDEVMKRMPINAALGAQVFFWTLITDLLNCIPNAMMEAGEVNTNGFSLNGQDITQHLAWLKVTSQELKKSVALTFTPA
jgi:hypothetical protein